MLQQELEEPARPGGAKKDLLPHATPRTTSWLRVQGSSIKGVTPGVWDREQG